MNDNVTPLRVVNDPVRAGTTEDGMLQSIATFLAEHGILEDFAETDVELDAPNSDETKVGELTAAERMFFVVGQLLNEIIREEMVEIEASNADVITKIMRDKKISMAEAAQVFAADAENQLTDEQRHLLNKLSMTMGNCLTAYEWAVRVRHNQWDRGLIVRTGFVVYAYG